MMTSFIEKQFPVSKVSKESYKERKANNGQTLTGLGKWWGRKPLVLVRAAILGCLLPATDNPKKDMANERANTCRLKTPQEFAMRTIGDVPDFESSTLRLILAAIHIAIKEEENPEKGLFHIKNNLPDYWGSRDMVA